MQETVEGLLGKGGGQGGGAREEEEDEDEDEDEDEESGGAEVGSDGSAVATGAGNRRTSSVPLARRILMGLNMYGTDNGQPITGGKYLELLREHKPRLVLDEDAEEHYFDYLDSATRQRHQVWFPSVYSLQKRLELAKELGIGVAMWEVGQGLDFFYDLF